MALSPDKQRVLAAFPAQGGKPARLVLLPTGPGEPKDLPIEKLEPDLGRIHAGREARGLQRRRPGSRGPALRSGHRGRQRAAIGPVGAYLMEYTSPVSPDGRSVIAYEKGLASVYPIDGGEGRAVPGVARGDRVVQWSADSRSVYTFSFRERPVKVFLVDLATGQKRLWREFPLDESDGRIRVRVTPDGRFYVYGTTATRSELYLVDALR